MLQRSKLNVCRSVMRGELYLNRILTLRETKTVHPDSILRTWYRNFMSCKCFTKNTEHRPRTCL